MLNAVDAAADPKPSNRYTVRVRGEAVDVPPKVTKKLETRARRWMIRPEWFKEGTNDVYDIPTRVAESGKAWGEEDDPEDLERKAQKFKEEKDIVTRKQKAKAAGKKKEKDDAEEAKVKKRAEKESKRVEREAKKGKLRAPEASGSGSRNAMNVDRLVDPALVDRSGAGCEDIDMDDAFWD